MQEARGDCLTGAVAPKTWNQGREVLGSPIAWLCLPLARPSWKGGAGASSSPLAQQAQGAQPGGCVGSGGEAGEPLRPAPTVGAHACGGMGHISYQGGGCPWFLTVKASRLCSSFRSRWLPEEIYQVILK